MSGRGRIYPPLAERFAANVDKTPGFGPRGDCWRWTGTLVHNGYGQICRAKTEGGRREYAHRVAYELHHRVDIGVARKTGPLVLHECDNRACVNPEHLFLGDDQDNVADMRTKGRWAPGNQKGMANPGSKLSDSEVIAIRSAAGTYEAVAQQFGISPSWAWTVRNRQAWTHLNEGVFA